MLARRRSSGDSIVSRAAAYVRDIKRRLALMSLDRDGALRVASLTALGKLASSRLR